jgi:hypothetical protein
MGDADQSSSAAERAGRAVIRALRGLFGDRFVVKAKESAEALRDEFVAGKREADDQPDPPRAIIHRDLESSSSDPEEP